MYNVTNSANDFGKLLHEINKERQLLTNIPFQISACCCYLFPILNLIKDSPSKLKSFCKAERQIVHILIPVTIATSPFLLRKPFFPVILSLVQILPKDAFQHTFFIC